MYLGTSPVNDLGAILARHLVRYAKIGQRARGAPYYKLELHIRPGIYKLREKVIINLVARELSFSQVQFVASESQ